MNNTGKPNGRPLLRTVPSLIVTAAALWTLTGSAQAQIYITDQGPSGGLVSKYNASNGSLIKARFIKARSSLVGLAIKENVLFVTDTIGTVGEYDSTTGAVINANFITGLQEPVGIAVKGKTLFVGNGVLTASIGKYNANTGKVITASFITGLVHPLGIVLMEPDPASPPQSFLFVSESGPTDLGSVGKYNAKSGTAINASFITGLTDAEGLAVLGSTLFVASYGSTPNGGGTVGTYDAATGAVINANFITGLSYPTGIALLGNSLFVVNYLTGTVGEYNATTGDVINGSFITGLTQPSEIVVKSSGD
jgi:hypothetical protein